MWSVQLLVLICAASFLASEIRAGCRTAEECIPLKDCTWIKNIFERHIIDDETTNILYKKLCGYVGKEAKVWCDVSHGACITPDKAGGFCAPLHKCSMFIDMLEQKPLFNEDTVSLIRQSECEHGKDNVAKVCCPLVQPKPKTKPTPKPTEKWTVPPDFPLPETCGIQTGENKIFGGEMTDIDEFPWMALLEYGDETNPLLLCGGSVISSRFVLTAAHCVHTSQIRRYGKIKRVRLGEYDIRNKTDCVLLSDPESDYVSKECMPDMIRAEVQSIIVHEQFSIRDQNGLHDIALIKLRQPIKFTEFVRPICLPINHVEIPKHMYVAGWGKTEIARGSNVKLKVQIPLYDKSECANIYASMRWPRNLGPNQVCAGGEPGRDSCAGDSGGPLMASIVNAQDKIWFQFGLVSYGPNKCGNGDPSVYTSVPDYIPWILDNIKK